jgi:hypothetical protein
MIEFATFAFAALLFAALSWSAWWYGWFFETVLFLAAQFFALCAFGVAREIRIRRRWAQPPQRSGIRRALRSVWEIL